MNEDPKDRPEVFIIYIYLYLSFIPIHFFLLDIY